MPFGVSASRMEWFTSATLLENSNLAFSYNLKVLEEVKAATLFVRSVRRANVVRLFGRHCVLVVFHLKRVAWGRVNLIGNRLQEKG